MKNLKIFCAFIFMFVGSAQLWAKNHLNLNEITENVYAIVGELGNRTPENFGNNATFGFVVTSVGVVLIDSGGTHEGAKAIKQIIETVTDKPVIKVINTGGQDHRWLGNDYFKTQGAEIIASKDAVIDQKARIKDQFFMLSNLVGEKTVNSTNPVHADTTFDNQYEFIVGDTKFVIFHKGRAHTPGDSFVWLPQKSVMFTGDIVYIDRLLGVLDHSNSKSWIHVFQSMAEFNPEYIVPGHGPVTNLAHAKRDTYDYLVDLRQAVKDFMDNGGDIADISEIDQSKYKYLSNYDVLSGRNAQQVFTELEWE